MSEHKKLKSHKSHNDDSNHYLQPQKHGKSHTGRKTGTEASQINLHKGIHSTNSHASVRKAGGKHEELKNTPEEIQKSENEIDNNLDSKSNTQAAEDQTKAEANLSISNMIKENKYKKWYRSIREKKWSQYVRKYYKKVFPHFPLCWDVSIMTTLKFLSILDVFVTLGGISLYLYFHQFAPFSERIRSNRSDYADINKIVSNNNPEGGAPVQDYDPSHQQGKRPLNDKFVYNKNVFHESTTELGPPLFEGEFDQAAESIRYSKLAYLNAKFQQEVETGCGSDYYVENLFGHKLNITRNLFYDIVKANYITYGFYLFVDLSVLVTTTAYFSYTSAKVYLMFLWELELLSVWCQIWTLIASKSQRLCIIEYGLGSTFRGVKYLRWFHVVPVMMFRAYKALVYSYFVHSFFTPEGYLHGEEDAQGPSLREYVQRQDEYQRMDKNREFSSSEEDEMDHMI